MQDFGQAFRLAFELVLSADPDLLEIILLSLRVSLSAVAIACVIGLPLGAAVATSRFRGRMAVIVLMNALMGLPPVVVGLLIYLYLPLAFNRRPRGFAVALRLAQAVLPWSMLEIFLLGVLVAAVKLAEQATIVPGPAAWSLGALVVVLAAASTQVHPRRLWEIVG